MGEASININHIIRDAYNTYCRKNGLVIGKKVEKLMILDLYKAGYDVKELIILNNGKNKGIELKKRVIVEQPKEVKKENIPEIKLEKDENNGI